MQEDPQTLNQTKIEQLTKVQPDCVEPKPSVYT